MLGVGQCNSACCNYTGGCSNCLRCNPILVPPTPRGWECPRCHRIYAPHVPQCLNSECTPKTVPFPGITW